MTSKLGFFSANALKGGDVPPDPGALFPGTVFQSDWEGVDAGQPTTDVDDSSYNHTIAYVSNARLTTLFSKFGGSSINSPGDGTSSVRVTEQTDEFDFAAGDFCIEFFVMRDTTDTNEFFLAKWTTTGSQRSWAFLAEASNSWSFYLSPDGVNSVKQFGGNLTGTPKS